MRARARALVRLGTLILALVPAATHAAATPPAAAATPPAVAVAPARDPDLLLGVLAAGAFALAATHDLEVAQHVASAPPSRTADHAADVFRQFGEPVVVGAALAGTWGVAHLTHAPGLEAATVRIGVAVVVPGAVCLGLKELIGRERPNQSPDDAWSFKPFSGDASLPSGHTTVAFAAATALDRETTARWVPWVVYPAAALTGWSRVHDREHWTSDVVAGAALGYWGARLTDDALRRRGAFEHATSVWVAPEPGGFAATITRRF